MKKLSGVYCIENLVNGKKYIGQSVNLEKRESAHFRALDSKRHTNEHLQRSYNKYKRKSFKFKILVYCEPFELTRYEQFFVDLYTPEVLYNICLECVNSKKGVPLTEEHKAKISKANSGENHAFYGKNLPKETREKMSKSRMGREHSEETRKKISVAKTGNKHSKEAKEKMSKARIGKKSSKETKEKMSKASMGENNPSSKLTEKDILEIRKLLLEKGITQTEIAKIYGVSMGMISRIKLGKSWKHIK